MKGRDDRFTIRRVAEATGLSLHTLRYYERIGLIHPIGRAENTHRRYSAGDIACIEFLTRLRATGMRMGILSTKRRRDDLHDLPFPGPSLPRLQAV